ncbi:unnamed protein product, partial [Ectocarpus sp. 12 AP-2014]
DLLEWSGDGDEGPGGGGGAGWDGTALALEFLRCEGGNLLVRYFVADGEVQRASLEDHMWSRADDTAAAAAAAAVVPSSSFAPPSPSQHRGGFSAESPSRHTVTSSSFS